MGKGSGKGKGKGEASVVAMAGWGHSNTVVTESTSGEKMGGAMCGVCVGPVLFIVALILVGWNEYHTVQVGKTIDAAESDSEDADCNTPVFRPERSTCLHELPDHRHGDPVRHGSIL